MPVYAPPEQAFYEVFYSVFYPFRVVGFALGYITNFIGNILRFIGAAGWAFLYELVTFLWSVFFNNPFWTTIVIAHPSASV